MSSLQKSTHSFSVATSCHGCLNTWNLNTGSHQIYLEENQPLPLLCFLIKRGPLNSVVPSTLPVTTMTWLWTARSITSATSRSGGRIKAGEDGDVFLHLSFSVLFLQLVNIDRSSPSVSAHPGCLSTRCAGICAAYPSGPAPLTSSSRTCPLARGNGSRAARPSRWRRGVGGHGFRIPNSVSMSSGRMGSKKKNWDLYPSCLREMARVCRPGSGKAVLLTQDKKCFSKVSVESLSGCSLSS